MYEVVLCSAPRERLSSSTYLRIKFSSAPCETKIWSGRSERLKLTMSRHLTISLCFLWSEIALVCGLQFARHQRRFPEQVGTHGTAFPHFQASAYLSHNSETTTWCSQPRNKFLMWSYIFTFRAIVDFCNAWCTHLGFFFWKGGVSSGRHIGV